MILTSRSKNCSRAPATDCCKILIVIIAEIFQHRQCPLSSESPVDSSSARQHAVTDDADEDIDELLKKILHLDSKYFLSFLASIDTFK